MSRFSDQLASQIRQVGNPVVVGLDPRWDLLPDELKLSDSPSLHFQAEVFEKFCRAVIDVVAPLVPAVKPQMAFFEELGPSGMTALSSVIAHAQENGLLVILDGKRGDIGSTAEAYARGILGRGQSAWGADALTINPYLGEDSLTPFVDVAIARESGLFVLVKTSNPGGGRFQDLISDGRPLYRHIAELVEENASRTAGVCGYGAVGAVVGATYPNQLDELRAAMPHTWFLVPGFGSQGGKAADVAGAFDAHGLGAIINNSRGILFAQRSPRYREKFQQANWQAAVEAATRDMIAELRAETSAGKLPGGG